MHERWKMLQAIPKSVSARHCHLLCRAHKRRGRRTTDPTTDLRRYNTPSVDEIAVLTHHDGGTARSLAQRRRRARERAMTTHRLMSVRPISLRARTGVEDEGHAPEIEFCYKNPEISRHTRRERSSSASMLSPTPSPSLDTEHAILSLREPARPLPSTRYPAHARLPSDSPSHSTSTVGAK
ncbi:hypothetical protein BC826DRAFT_980013, partial [Russula brevipes]